jgi:hypothetical protein
MPESVIAKLPAHLRTDALNRISANANAPGGAKRQTNGRAQQAALQRLAGTMGIYVIETNPTGPLAVSVGGPIPGSISVEAGTPATVNVVAGVAPAPPPLVPVTWAAAGPRSLTEQVSNTLAGNAKLAIA